MKYRQNFFEPSAISPSTLEASRGAFRALEYVRGAKAAAVRRIGSDA